MSPFQSNAKFSPSSAAAATVPLKSFHHSSDADTIMAKQIIVSPAPSTIGRNEGIYHGILPSPSSDQDLLLAQSGYNVKASELPILAERLEQLESLINEANSEDFPYFPPEGYVMHNPSDMGGWLENLLGELNPPAMANPNPNPNLNPNLILTLTRTWLKLT